MSKASELAESIRLTDAISEGPPEPYQLIQWILETLEIIEGLEDVESSKQLAEVAKLVREADELLAADAATKGDEE